MLTLNRIIRVSTVSLYILITSRLAAQSYYSKNYLSCLQKIIYLTILVGFGTTEQLSFLCLASILLETDQPLN